MAAFEAAYKSAIIAGTLPGVVLLAADVTGKFTYTKAEGVQSVRAGIASKLLEPDTIIALASCTKLLTAIAVLQCVEDGLFTLDEDLTRLLPDLAAIPIISSPIDPTIDQFTLTPRQIPMTLRHLLSHSSGLAYDLLSPLLQTWRASRNETPWTNPTVETRANHPLLFDPGTGWMYGVGTDWAGKLIERITSQSLEAYMSSRIWGPLGLSDMTFWPRTKAHMAERRAEMSTWNQDGKCVSLGENFDFNNSPTDCTGGGGAFGSAQDFFKLMQAVLREDERLLKKAKSWEELFRPQLTAESEQALQRLLESGDELNLELGANVPLSGGKSWSLGGLVSLDRYEGWMREGTMLWSGMPNIRWFIDRKTGLCGLVAAQLLAGEAKPIKELSVQFQKGIYEMFAESKA